MDQQIGKKLKHFTDYASKETLGRVHAGGFLHHSVRIIQDGTSTAPSQLSNAERKRRITETWRKHLAKFPSTAKRPVIAHRLVFSMSKEQHDALTDAGINPDQVLHSTMKKVMRRFNEKYHPNDSIGYAYGIHHDTAHLHVHVAISGRFEEFWDFFASPKELPVSGTREGFNKGRECTELQERRDCLRNACAAGRIL
jgi:hypothetical protein